MNIFTALVRDGRLVVLDPEAASLGLKEGESVDLVAVDELLFQGGCLSENDERATLERTLETSIEEADAGLVYDLDEVLASLREKGAAG